MPCSGPSSPCFKYWCVISAFPKLHSGTREGQGRISSPLAGAWTGTTQDTAPPYHVGEQSQMKPRVAISIFTLQQILPQNICELQYASLEAEIHLAPYLVFIRLLKFFNHQHFSSGEHYVTPMPNKKSTNRQEYPHISVALPLLCNLTPAQVLTGLFSFISSPLVIAL